MIILVLPWHGRPAHGARGYSRRSRAGRPSHAAKSTTSPKPTNRMITHNPHATNRNVIQTIASPAREGRPCHKKRLRPLLTTAALCAILRITAPTFAAPAEKPADPEAERASFKVAD